MNADEDKNEMLRNEETNNVDKSFKQMANLKASTLNPSGAPQPLPPLPKRDRSIEVLSLPSLGSDSGKFLWVWRLGPSTGSDGVVTQKTCLMI